MGPPSASEGDGVLVSDTLMHGDTGLHLQIVLQYGHIVIITELTVTGNEATYLREFFQSFE